MAPVRPRWRASRTWSAAFLLVWLARLGAASDDRTGTLSGTVTDEVTHRPLEAATVSVEDTALTARTDAAGRFQLTGVPAGVHRLRVEAAGYVPRYVTDVVVTAGHEAVQAMALAPAPTHSESVEVQASSFFKLPDAPASVFGLTYEEIRRAPGAFGGDVGRLVQSLPGLAGRDDLRNDIVARGGSPSENLILVDGIEVPSLSHFGAQGASGGPITMLSAEVVSDARFLAGAFPVRHGDRLSSVLEVWLREGSRRRAQAEIDVGTAGAGLIAEGPLGGRGSWLVSARRSYVDLIAGAVDASAIPVYANYQAKVTADVTAADRLTLVSVGGRETIAVDVAEQDDDDPNILDTDQRGWRATTGLTWQRLLGGRGVGTLALSESLMSQRTDAWDTTLGDQLVLHNDSRERESALRCDLTYQAGALGTLSVGLSAKRLGTELDRRQPLGEEDPLSSDPARVNAYDIAADYATWQGAGYVQVLRPVGSAVTITLGGRFEHFAAAGASRLSPRASVGARVAAGLELSLAAGRHYQMPGLVFLRAHPDNARLEPMRADHVVAGASWTPRPDVRASIEAYTKRYARYPVARTSPSISLANLGDAYDTGLFLAPMVSEGDGRTWGIELFLQKKLGRRLYGQASYAYARAKHRALDGVWRPGAFDLPHVATVVGGVKVTRTLEVSAKATTTSGRPVTPFDLAASTAQNREVLDTARINAERAPEYHRLDFRVDRRFALGWGNLVLYLEVDNVTNRENVRAYLWDKRRSRVDTEPQAGRMWIGGLNLEL